MDWRNLILTLESVSTENWNIELIRSQMDKELLSDIRNKLTAPKTALEKLANGEKVPKEFLELALKKLKTAIALLQKASRSARVSDKLRI